MGSKTLPSACYILSDESSIPFYSTRNGCKKPTLQGKIQTVNTSVIDTYGTLNLTFGLSLKRKFSWTFVAANFQSAIIEVDFLSYHGQITVLKGKRLMDSLTSLSTKI